MGNQLFATLSLSGSDRPISVLDAGTLPQADRFISVDLTSYDRTDRASRSRWESPVPGR